MNKMIKYNLQKMNFFYSQSSISVVRYANLGKVFVMKKHLWLWLSVCIAPAFGISESNAAEDPFSVIEKDKTYSDCLNQEIDKTSLSLRNLAELAICRNATLARSYITSKQQAAAYGQSMTSYLPNINLGAGASYSENKAGYGSDWEDSSPVSANVSLDWLLYDFGGRQANKDYAYQNFLAAGFSHNQQMQDTLFNVANAYYTLLSAKAALQESKANEDMYLKSYELAAKKYELGLVSLSDKLQAETSYAQSRLATLEDENSINIAKGNLAEILNLPAYTDFALAKVNLNAKDAFFNAEVKDLIDKALQERNDLKVKQAEIKAAEASLKQAEAADYPSVSLNGSFAGSDDLSSGHGQNYNGRIGVQLTVPLFTGFSNTYSKLTKKYALESAKESLAETTVNIRKDVWNKYHDYTTAVKNYEITGTLLKSSQENYKVALGAYKAGKNDIVTLLDAASKLALARKERSSALYKLFLSKTDLLRAIGKLEIQ